MTFTDILLLLIVLAIAGYGIVFYIKTRLSKEIQKLEEDKEVLMANSIADNLFLLKNTNLSGQTKRKYENFVATWQQIQSFQLAEIEANLVGAQQYADQMNIIKSRKILSQVSHMLDEVYDKVNALAEEVESLTLTESDNQLKNETLHERYNEARKSIMTHSFDYGPAIETLEKNVQYLELDFTKYNEAMTNGDFLEAQTILDTIEANLTSLEEILTKIPAMYDQIKNDYEDSIEDLRQGYEKMVGSRFNFDGINVPEKLDEIQEKLNEAKVEIKNADLADAQILMDRSERDIRSLYDMMETEVNAKDYVVKNINQLRASIEDLIDESRYVSIETDRIAQSYILHQNEVDRIADLIQQIQIEQSKFNELVKLVERESVIYTSLETNIKKIRKRVDDIEEKVREVAESISQLPVAEKESKSNLDLFELDLRNLKRRVEKSHLPGLNEEYYQLFYRVSEDIENLAKQLNRVRIDMDEIELLERELSERLTELEELTAQTIDDATLTEYMIQHGNRFRYDMLEVEQAIREAQTLFYEEYQYSRALATIEKVLYRIDQEGVSQVRKMFKQEKERRGYHH